MRKTHKILASAAAVAVVASAIYLRPNAPISDLVGIQPIVSGVANPDITQDNIQDNICNPNWSTKSIRPPVSYTNPLKMKLLQDPANLVNGDTNPADYELDHAWSLTDSGNPTDPNNLWLEPYNISYNGEPMGARQKDKYELYVHKQICDGEITLDEAHARLSEWWVYYLQAGLDKSLGGVQSTDQEDN